MDTHGQKKKETKKKDPLLYSSINNNNTFTTKTTVELQQCTSAIIVRSKILNFYPEDSLHSQHNAFNKAIVRHNQLRPDIGFLP
jgi:hypothetical protein